jgi:hypothetical protein
LNRWLELRPRSFRDSLRVAPTTCTSTAASRFKGSCVRGSFNISLSLASLCSLEREFLCSAVSRATCGSITSQLGTSRAAWFRASTVLIGKTPTHGGNPDMLPILEEDTYAFWVDFSRRPGGESGVDGGAMWWRSGVPFVTYNGVAGVTADVDATFARLRGWGVPARWTVSSASTPTWYEAALEQRGLTLYDEWPGMVACQGRVWRTGHSVNLHTLLIVPIVSRWSNCLASSAIESDRAAPHRSQRARLVAGARGGDVVASQPTEGARGRSRGACTRGLAHRDPTSDRLARPKRRALRRASPGLADDWRTIGSGQGWILA